MHKFNICPFFKCCTHILDRKHTIRCVLSLRRHNIRANKDKFKQIHPNFLATTSNDSMRCACFAPNLGSLSRTIQQQAITAKTNMKYFVKFSNFWDESSSNNKDEVLYESKKVQSHRRTMAVFPYIERKAERKSEGKGGVDKWKFFVCFVCIRTYHLTTFCSMQEK